MDLTSRPPSSQVQPAALSPSAQRVLKILMFIAGPLFMLALLEGTAFVWEKSQANGPFAWELVASRRIRLVTYSQPGSGYTLMQPGSRYTWGGIPVVINSHGLRDPEISYAKPAGVFRILNLGDSIAMGWGARQEDRYGPRLQAALNGGTNEAGRYQVVDAGVPGWAPMNEAAYLQAEGLKYQPDLLVLDFTLTNDIGGKSALLENVHPPLVNWLRDHTYTYPFLTIEGDWISSRMKGKARIKTIDPPTNPSRYFPPTAKDPLYDQIWGSILEIKSLAARQNIPMVMVVFPLEFQVLDPTYSTLAQQVLSERAQAAGIPVIDLLPSFQQACEAKPGGPCQLEDHYLFSDVWMHPSAVGHGLAMEAIRSWMVEQGLAKP